MGAALWFVPMTTAFGQVGETCDQPIVLPGEGTYAFDNSGFTGSGFGGATGSCSSGPNYVNDIFFEFVVPRTGRYRFILSELENPLGASLYRGDRCAGTCFGSMPSGSLLTISVSAGEKLLLQAGSTNGPGGQGLLTVRLDLCLSNLDDAFEDNDSPGEAVPLAPGFHGDLVVRAGDDDYYSLTLQPGEQLAVVATVPVPFNFIGVDLTSPTQGTQTSMGTAYRALTCINESTTAPKEVLLRVSDAIGGLDCGSYELDVNVALGCGFAADDAFEPNDVCLDAAPLDEGTTRDLTLSEGELDFYSIQIPPLTTATVNVQDSYFRSVGLRAVDGSCVVQPAAPGPMIRVSNASASTTLTARFEAAITGSGNSGCTSYALDLRLDESDCTSLPADVFEPNDSCQSAAPILLSGDYVGLTIGLAEVDYYTFTMQPFQRLFARAVGSGTLNMRLLDGNCDVIQEGENFVLLGTIDETEIQQLTLEVTVDTFFTVPCLDYLLEFDLGFDPCSPLLEDAFEPNDTCAAAVPIADGFYPELSVTDADNDYFDVLLQPGETFAAETFVGSGSTRVNLSLWSGSGPCGFGTGGTPVASSMTFTQTERVTYVHQGSTPQRYVLEVALRNPPFCTRYALTIDGAAGRPVGTSYCVAASNSTGGRAAIEALGSTSATANQLRLTTTSLPANAFGFYLVSRTQGLVVGAGGSFGRLCLGGTIGRYQRPGEVMGSGPAGEFSLDLDLTDTPQPLGSVSVLPGDTWFWTTWFRDQEGGVAVSNFSNGLEVLFL
jgi:hypothetical protein